VLEVGVGVAIWAETNPAAVRRICIEILSDVLLLHHAVNTRRWLSALLPTLKSKGFTTLAVVNPRMHPQRELEAILGIFDGEIRLTEKETPEGYKQVLSVHKLLNQKYREEEIVLT
jgi:KaiC/GvpD/RAD55 family RecA-like ATPase